MHITSRKGLLALVVLASGCLVAACGSASGSGSSSSSTTGTTASASAAGSGGTGSSRRAALVACLKQHGVTLPARPPGSGGGAGGSSGAGGSGGTGTGTTPRPGFFFGGGGPAANPKLRAAFQACGARFGFGGGAGRFRGRRSRTAITNYVTCVRQHGYNLPNPNFSGKGPVFPANIRSKAKFQAASRACQSLLVPPRGSAPPGGTNTTSGA